MNAQNQTGLRPAGATHTADATTAAGWYEKSARSGIPEAAFNLG